MQDVPQDIWVANIGDKAWTYVGLTTPVPMEGWKGYTMPSGHDEWRINKCSGPLYDLEFTDPGCEPRREPIQ